MSSRSEKTPTRHITPSEVQHQLDKLLLDFEALRNHLKNQVLFGVQVGTPTTGSSQGAGVGNTDWNVNITAGMVVVDGVAAQLAAQVDYNVHTGSMYTNLHSGDSAIATILAQNSSGTVTMVVVKGTAAVTGSQVAPTDAEIQTALGAGVSWVKIAEVLLNRTGDATVTQSEDNTKRPLPAVNEDSAFGDWSAYT